jgi:catechol 2,3-dioxygenase-like lactoylglutathione lyase family enzyme
MDWKLELVVVPVSDVDRSKQFYSEQLGFNVDVDSSPNEQFRVVQLTPPGSACSISIGKGLTEAIPGSLEGMQICVGDIDAAHAQLVERGVDVSPIRHVGEAGWADGKGGDYNSFIFFKDPDGKPYTPDFAALARSCGAWGTRVNSAAELAGALQEALAAGGPALVDVPMVNDPVPTPGHWNINDIYRGKF